MNILLTYHPFWISLIIAIALCYVFAMYFKENQIAYSSKWIKNSLFLFRGFTAFTILFLLYGIIIEKSSERIEKPLLFVLQDQSESIIQTKDSLFYKGKFVNDLHNLKINLTDKFDVVEYGFSNNTTKGLDTLYLNKNTDISSGISHVFNQYHNRNIGAIILASDGIYNKGTNPEYTTKRKLGIPIFTIGMGDTTSFKDVKIVDINHNEIAFNGNYFPVEVSVAHSGFKGEKILIKIYEESKLIVEKKIELKRDDEIIKHQFNLISDRNGYNKYTIKLSQINEEFTYKNNDQNFYINIIDGRQKILLAYNNVHPDISALKFAISESKDYEVDAIEIKKIDHSIEQYDLIMIHNYHAGSLILDEIINNKSKPILFIVGLKSELNQLSKLGIGFTGMTNQFEDVSFKFNPQFNDIKFDRKVINLIEHAPPLKVFIGNLIFGSQLNSLGNQKVGGINLSHPLIYFGENEKNKYGVIFGEGIWQWRLYDQMKNKETRNFQILISKMVSYLSLKEDKDPFKINIEAEYEETEYIVVEAELYNKSYDLINDSEINLKLKDEKGNALDNKFHKVNNSYRLDLGRLDPGLYSWTAMTIINNKKLHKSGVVLINKVQKELLNLSANHRLLKIISMQSGAKFFYPNELDLLEQELLNRKDLLPVIYEEKDFDDLIDFKWLFFMLLIFLSLEWFIRKFNGGY